MHTLIIMRHAKTVRADAGIRDETRQLTPRGVSDAHAAAEALHAFDLQIGSVLVSPSTRTQQTAASVQTRLQAAKIKTINELYLADANTLFRFAASQSESVVLVIAHNPGLHDLAAHFVNLTQDYSQLANSLREGFPTSAFAAFRLTGETFAAPGASLLGAWRVRD